MKFKNIFIIVVLLFSSLQMKANDDIIDKISNLDELSMVSISKPMLGLMRWKKAGGINIGSIVSKLNSMTIFSGRNSQASAQLRTQAIPILKGLTKEGYEPLMKVKEKDSNVDMYVKMKGEIVTSFLMIVDEKSEFVIIHLDGNIPLDEIQRLTSKVK